MWCRFYPGHSPIIDDDNSSIFQGERSPFSIDVDKTPSFNEDAVVPTNDGKDDYEDIDDFKVVCKIDITTPGL
jgi:hypothetical protein